MAMVICNRKFRCCTSTSWREQHLNFPSLVTWRSFITSHAWALAGDAAGQGAGPPGRGCWWQVTVPWPHWLPKSPEHILNSVVYWVECCSINSWNRWSASICCCIVRTVTWLPMWSKMAYVYLDGTPSRMSWTENRHVPDSQSLATKSPAPGAPPPWPAASPASAQAREVMKLRH